MQYTCIKKDDKYAVMEYVGKEPREREYFKNDIDKYYSDLQTWQDMNLDAYKNALPTLPEHSAYWATMEGEVFGEDVFELNYFTERGENITMHKEEFTGKNQSNFITAVDKTYAIPKQQEQDNWDDIIGIITQHTILGYDFDSSKKELQDKYTLTKKH